MCISFEYVNIYYEHKIFNYIFCMTDVLAEALYLSVDPYMRSLGEFIPAGMGITMVGGQVAK